MSRRSIVSEERVNNNFTAISNASGGAVLQCVIVDVCGAHKPTTRFIPMEMNQDGELYKGFYGSGIELILFDLINKRMISTPWKRSYDYLRSIYGTDENIIGRNVNLHCSSNSTSAIAKAAIEWGREDDILFENESNKGYVSLAGVASMVVNDYESQMKAFANQGVGKGRKWNRI